MAAIPLPLFATVADFELTFGTYETIELSELDNPSNTVVNNIRIQNYLDQAAQYIIGIDAIACTPGQLAIRLNLKRLQLDIARYYADVLKLRPDIEKRYQEAVRFCERGNDAEFCKAAIEVPDGYGLTPTLTNYPIKGISGENALESSTGNYRLSLFRVTY